MSNLIKLTNTLATRFGMDSDGVMETLKATAFKGQVSDAQMTALLIVANQYGLNPWTKEIYAFPDKQNGIVPVVGVDGWSRIINDHPQFDGMEFRQSESMVTPEGAKASAPEWMECVMYRKDRRQPIVIREYLDEVYRKPFKKETYTVDGPWQTHPKRFLRHKCMIQCSRIAFGFAGIYDQDEAERIVDMGMVERVQPATTAPSDTYAQFEADVLPFLRDAAVDGMAALQAAFASVPPSNDKTQLWKNHSEALKGAAESADKAGESTTAEGVAA